MKWHRMFVMFITLPPVQEAEPVIYTHNHMHCN